MLKYRIIDLLKYPLLIIRLLLQHLKFKHQIKINKYFYGKERNQFFYFFMPKTITKDKVIFFVNGSGWTSYFAFIYKFVGSFFCRFGYVSIICSHRKVPKHTFPAQIDDIVFAIKKTLKLIESYEIGANFVLMGYSSGAQIICLLTYSNYLAQNGISKDIIKGVISISGPINFYECKNKLLCKVIKNYVQTLTNKESADPYSHLLSNNLKPILCVHDRKDPFVEVENSKTFIDKVNQLDNGKGSLILLEHYYHHNILKIFLFPNYNQELLKWLDKLS